MKLADLSNELEIFKSTHLREHNDKLAIYRTAIDIVATMISKLEMIILEKREPLSSVEHEAFEVERLRVYGYLAMLAPQEVMDANDHLTDILIGIVYDDRPTTWEEIRDSALKLTNAMRTDIGLNKDKLKYNGER